ncbi:hypothetical protein [Paenibacillus sp. FSL R5-0519]|uniref:hypothetical protein n=1 Tax=Paenibacillus sp. FSL R5-0519 TaxID=2921648 RepID=UPI0030D6D0DE
MSQYYETSDVYVITGAVKKDAKPEADSFATGKRVIPRIIVNGPAYLFNADNTQKAIMTSRVQWFREDDDRLAFETVNTTYELTKESAK